MSLKRYFLVVLCVALFGCKPVYDDEGNEIGYDKDKAKYKWGEWGGELTSIINDSLAIVAMYKPYYKEWLLCGESTCTTLRETANHHVGLFLVNYREKQKPIWGDTLEHNLIVVKEYFRDSSVLVFDRKNNKFGFWKIGTKEIGFVDYDDYSEIENRGYIGYNARSFANGNVILFSYPKLFLLEVENRQLKPFEFSGEYKWLSECVNSLRDDRYDYMNMSYIGGELSCIRGNKTAENFELTVNNIIMDTSSLGKSYVERIIGWYGPYVEGESGVIYKIDTLNFKFDNSYVYIRLDKYNAPIFYAKGLEPIDYSTQDLLGVYE